MSHKWSSLSVVHDCGSVLGSFYTEEDYKRFRSDEWRSKYLKTTDCPSCKKPIDWEKCVKAQILETRIDSTTNAPKVHFEEVELDKKEISELERKR